MRAITPLAISLAVYGGACTFFIAQYCARWGLSSRVIPVHLYLVLLGLLSILGAGFLFLRSTGEAGRHRVRMLTVTALWLFFTIQSLLYTMDWFALAFMGNTISFRLLLSYLLQAGDAWKLFPFSIRAALLYFLVVQFFCVAVSVILERFIHTLAPLEPDVPLRTGRKTWRRLLTACAASVYVFAAVQGGRMIVTPDMSYEGEPITGLFGYPMVSVAGGRQLMPEVLDKDIYDDYRNGKNFRNRNVILIFVDDMRADHMALYGYERPTTPYLTSLYDKGQLHKVETALVTSPSTITSLASMLTSRTCPDRTGSDLMLPDILSELGYSVRFILSGNWKTFLRAGDVITRGKYPLIDGHGSRAYAIGDDRVVLEKLEEVPADQEQPLFLFLGILAPHLAGYRQEQFEKFLPTSNTFTVSESGDAIPVDVSGMINNYDNGILQSDALISEVFGILEEKGLLEDSIIVLFSDHGEGFGEHDARNYGHARFLYQENLRVPLLLYGRPGEYPALPDFASLLDIPPTVLDILGLPVPATFEGTSLFAPEHDRLLYHYVKNMGRCQYKAVTYQKGEKRYKFIRDDGRLRNVPSSQFFELDTDPGELEDLVFSGDQAILRFLSEQLEEESGRWRF